MKTSQVQKILKIAREKGFITSKEASRQGIHSQILTRLVREGTIERITRGQYREPNTQITEHHTLAVVSRAVPESVVCLLSSLSFHGIGTEIPAKLWLAIDRRSRHPNVGYPPLRIVKFSGKAFKEGVEIHRIEGQAVRVYSIAKTIADLFKYRNKIGLDVVLEALREAWRDHRFTMDEIDRYARICRVQRVITPYLEAMIT
jgi:predicted transcriptional regulator of viral defense system